jgi:nitrogen fixation-related uncharacterized protein
MTNIQMYVVLIVAALALAIGFISVFVWLVKGGQLRPVEKVKFRMAEEEKGD